MKRVRILPAPGGAPLAKKECLPIMHLIPVDNMTMSNPIIIGNETATTVNTMSLQLEENITDSDNVVYSIVEHMDITRPLSTLRTLLEARLGISLFDYKFYLQDIQELDANRNLVRQCVQGEGTVQINVEVSEKDGVKKINILDVLKPAEEIAITMNSDGQGSDGSGESSTELNFSDDSIQTSSASPQPENITRWIAANDFIHLQNTLKIPIDPANWNADHVRFWIRWAAGTFTACSINIGNWKLDGSILLSLTREGFRKKVPIDPDDLFWTHLELLRKCKIVAVLQNPPQNTMKPPLKPKPKVTKPVGSRLNYDASNCQTQLWQFLLELLTDKDHRDHIQWVGTEGEFKLINPEMVAYLWGKRKNKPNMNYEKLSRALRYYYDGELIAKVHGKRFVYRFVYDLKRLLGYSAEELNRLVCEDEMRSIQANAAPSTSTSNMEFFTDVSGT